MSTRICCLIETPIREHLSWEQVWKADDRGLIRCWERGRKLKEKDSDLAVCASAGELVILPWRGGVEEKLKIEIKKDGTLNYLAMWRGLRGECLDIGLSDECVIECSRTRQKVCFSNSEEPE